MGYNEGYYEGYDEGCNEDTMRNIMWDTMRVLFTHFLLNCNN